MRGPELVAVEWDDAHGSIADTVMPLALGSSHEPAIMTTVGWLLRLDNEGVSIANEMEPGSNGYRGHTFVPLGMIRSIRNLTKQPLHRRPLIYIRED